MISGELRVPKDFESLGCSHLSQNIRFNYRSNDLHYKIGNLHGIIVPKYFYLYI